MDKVKNLVLQGGSVRGFAYIGAIQELVDRGIVLSEIEQIAGTSAGAITALLLSLGYSAEELNGDDGIAKLFDVEIFTSESKALSDRKMGKTAAKLTGGHRVKGGAKAIAVAPKAAANFIDDFGLVSSNHFRDSFEEIIKNRTGIKECTFLELHNLRKTNPHLKDLYITGVNVNTGLSEVFSYQNTPNAVVANAVAISMSIPFIFQPRNLLMKDEHGDVRADNRKHLYIDGGVLDNYPAFIFKDEWEETLGLRLVSCDRKDFFEGTEEPSTRNISNGLQFALAALNAFRASTKADSDHARADSERARTIYIDTVDVGTLDFKLTEDQKEKLKNSGKEAVSDYFDRVEERSRHRLV